MTQVEAQLYLKKLLGAGTQVVTSRVGDEGCAVLRPIPSRGERQMFGLVASGRGWNSAVNEFVNRFMSDWDEALKQNSEKA